VGRVDIRVDLLEKAKRERVPRIGIGTEIEMMEVIRMMTSMSTFPLVWSKLIRVGNVEEDGDQVMEKARVALNESNLLVSGVGPRGYDVVVPNLSAKYAICIMQK